MFTLRLLKIKIHSRRVFMFKRCLPIFAFLLASIMITWPAFVEEKEKFSVPVPSLNVKEGGGVDMENVKFFSKDKRDNPMNITAKTVQEIDSVKKILKLNDPMADYKTADGIFIQSISPYALAFQNEKYLYFEDEITSTTDTGYEAISKKVTYDYHLNTISSENDVFVKGVAAMLRANGFFISEKGEKIEFKGTTKTVLFNQEKSIDTVKTLVFEKQKEYYNEDPQNIMITSEAGLLLNQMEKTVSAFKNANIYQKGRHIKAEKIVLTYEKDKYNKNNVIKAEAFQKVQAIEGKRVAQSEKMVLYKDKDEIKNVLKRLDFKGYKFSNQVTQLVHLNQKAMIKEGNQLVLADKMYVLYHLNDKGIQEIDKILTSGSVKASNGVQMIEGDYGIYNPTIKTVDVYDNVRVKQGDSVLTGKWANLNLQTGVSTLKADKTQKRVSGSLIPTDFEQKSEDK